MKGHFKAERVIILSTSLRALADTDPDEPVLLARSVAASSLRAKDTSKPQHVVHDGLLVVASLYDDHNAAARRRAVRAPRPPAAAAARCHQRLRARRLR